MKTCILFIILLISLCSNAQILYSWYPSSPSWTSMPVSSNSTFSYQDCAEYVSTSDCNESNTWFAYNNNQKTSYTSPTYNFSCSTYIRINIDLFINLENTYDWLYFMYSINDGATWINPVSSGAINQSHSNLSAYPPLTNWTNNNCNRNGWTGDLGFLTLSYDIAASSTTKFKFIFESDASINSYNGNIYYADIYKFSIECPDPLPITLLSFKGYSYSDYNLIKWITANEINNEYYIIERSIDAINFQEVGKLTGAGNSSTLQYYEIKDFEFNETTYYRLTQVDYNGDHESFSVISVMNFKNNEELKIVKITNIIGQEVSETYSGIQLIYFSNGTIIKKYQNK